MKQVQNKSGATLIEGIVVLVIAVIIASVVFAQPIVGAYPFGPEKVITAKVTRLYVDYSGGKDSSSSHYMVGTDKGVFEVDNSVWLGIWNADEIYSKLEQGKTYRLTTKGNQFVNFMAQWYAGIIAVEETK